MSPIFWDDGPASPQGQRLPIPVWSIRPGTKAFIRFLGAWSGVWLHWDKNRTRPCHGDNCPLCLEDNPRRWSGYAPALLWTLDLKNPKMGHWKAIVCPITESMIEVLEGHEIAGLIVEVARPGRRHNGPIHCSIIEKQVKDPPPPAFDVKAILMKMWGIRQQPRPQTSQTDNGEKPDVLPFRLHDQTDSEQAAEG